MTEEVYAPIINEDMTVTDALNQVCKISRAENKLLRGARQTSKALMRNKAKLVILSNDAQKEYKEIITFLAKKSNIPIIKVDDGKILAEIVGLKRVNVKDIEKMSKCCCACIVDYVRNSEGRIMIENMILKE